MNFLCLSFLLKGPSRPFEASREGVGFGPPSHVYASASPVDISRVEKRRGCKFLPTAFDFVQALPRALSDVTLSSFSPQGL